MVDACVYAWAFSLSRLWAFGDASLPQGMPTFFLCAYLIKMRMYNN